MEHLKREDFPVSGQETIIFSKKKYPRYVNGVPNDATVNTGSPSDVTTNDDVVIEITPRSFSSGVRLFVLCFVTVLFNVIMNVSLPVFAGTMEYVGGGMFALLLYGALYYPFVLGGLTLFLKVTVDKSLTLYPTCRWRVYLVMGLTTTLNGVGVVFASPPSRTAPYLQGVLATIIIPFTVLCRLVLLRKGISLRRLGCTLAVLVGIFITIEPQIWSLPGSGNESAGGSTTAHVIWPMIFALGFLPAAINTVVCERELKQAEAQSLSFITWTQMFQLLTILPLFWVDFIPFFGMAKSFGDFSHRLNRGFGCNFSSADDCHGLAYKGWIFILGYCLANLFQFLLIQKAEGAIFAVVVQSMTTPLATLFWTFFKFDVPSDRFYWDPEFTETTGFTVGGLVMIVPAVILYNLFSKWDAQEAKKTEENSENE
ncbi:crt homolog 3-like [Littorina saxatilis]|uniref:Uncharacterized protein n=1 Tax=Littorina saxatilis TaxID=31220 RepID=A0AAN9AVM5_9CAEN